jgi:manganese/zinc/iron transport system permease protein
MTAFVQALFLQGGYNAALVAMGAALLGAAAGATGAFLYMRKRALVSDAVSHATLPGIGIAFLVMVALGGDGRWLPGLLAGSAASAGLGLLAVEWMERRTRLAEDAAIGAVLSVFFGFGIVLLTVIQSLPTGKQAGLQGFLLGSTAGMLMSEAVMIAAGGAVAVAAVWALRRAMAMVAFDPGFAGTAGVPVRAVDLAMMGLVTAVTVIGLKIVGLVLIVALLIIPPVAARFWTERAGQVALIAAGLGGMAGYVGVALSASAPKLPTGPMVVLCCFALFLVSILFAPARGVVARVLRHRRFQRVLHRRQGLLALAHGEPVVEPLTLRILRREGLIRADGVATEAGRGQAARALREEKRHEIARGLHRDEGIARRLVGLEPLENVLTPDEVAEIDRRMVPVAVP